MTIYEAILIGQDMLPYAIQGAGLALGILVSIYSLHLLINAIVKGD